MGKVRLPPHHRTPKKKKFEVFEVLSLSTRIVWKNSTLIRANVKNNLMFTKSARKKRGKLDWNAIGIGLSSHEVPV